MSYWNDDSAQPWCLVDSRSSPNSDNSLIYNFQEFINQLETFSELSFSIILLQPKPRNLVVLLQISLALTPHVVHVLGYVEQVDCGKGDAADCIEYLNKWAIVDHL